MSDLYRKVGTSEPDNLITGLTPAVDVVMLKVKKLAAEATLKRGTVLGVDATGAVLVLGTAGATLTASYILAEDALVGTAEDAPAVAYRAGCFSPDHVTVAESYTITDADLDNLRMRNIVFKAFNA